MMSSCCWRTVELPDPSEVRFAIAAFASAQRASAAVDELLRGHRRGRRVEDDVTVEVVGSSPPQPVDQIAIDPAATAASVAVFPLIAARLAPQRALPKPWTNHRPQPLHTNQLTLSTLRIKVVGEPATPPAVTGPVGHRRRPSHPPSETRPAVRQPSDVTGPVGAPPPTLHIPGGGGAPTGPAPKGPPPATPRAKLRARDSNPEYLFQREACCRYTSPQCVAEIS